MPGKESQEFTTHPANPIFLKFSSLHQMSSVHWRNDKRMGMSLQLNTPCPVPTPKPSTTLLKSGGAASQPSWQTRWCVGVLCVDKDCPELQKMRSWLWRLLGYFTNKQINEFPFSKESMMDLKRISQAQNHTCFQIFIKSRNKLTKSTCGIIMCGNLFPR